MTRSPIPARVAARSLSLHLRSALGVLVLTGSGCTPLGMWLYEDPRFNLIEVTRAADSTDRRLQFVFDGCNTNDYDLQADSLATFLSVSGRQAGENHETSSIILPSRTALRLSVKMTTSVDDTPDGMTQLPFMLTNETIVFSPLGPRRVELRQQGTVTLQDGVPVSWQLKDSQGCRPGESRLPPALGRGGGRPIYVPPPPPPIPGGTGLPR